MYKGEVREAAHTVVCSYLRLELPYPVNVIQTQSFIQADYVHI